MIIAVLKDEDFAMWIIRNLIEGITDNFPQIAIATILLIGILIAGKKIMQNRRDKFE